MQPFLTRQTGAVLCQYRGHKGFETRSKIKPADAIGINRNQELPNAGRIAFGIEERAGLITVICTNQCRRQDFHD